MLEKPSFWSQAVEGGINSTLNVLILCALSYLPYFWQEWLPTYRWMWLGLVAGWTVFAAVMSYRDEAEP